MRLGVLTSGGDAPGMNAAIRAVVRAGIYHSCQITGFRRGLAGLLNREAQEMDLGSVADIINRGGTILHTSRSQEFKDNGVGRAAGCLADEGVEGLVIIGGEGSVKAAACMAQAGVPVVAIPATIDNDVAETDACIGFDTAVNTIVSSVDRVRDTASALERGFVIEVMGRDTGHLALAAGLAAGAESILVPEIPVSLEDVCDRLRRGVERDKRHSIIMVAEGVRPASRIAAEIWESVRLEMRVTVLGHVQRGGPPTVADRILASRMGERAVEALLSGRCGGMIGTRHGCLWEADLAQVASGLKELDLNLYRLAHKLSI